MADEITIQFIVEDGTCVSNANSYPTLEYANQYQTNKNRADWLALSDEDKMVSLIQATQYVDTTYPWKGRKKFHRNQYLSFPRVEITDIDGESVDGVIPHELLDAVCEASYYAYKANLEEGELFVTYNENGALKRDKSVVSGAVEKEVEFFKASDTAIEYISKYAALDSILRGLYISKDFTSVNAKAVWSW